MNEQALQQQIQTLQKEVKELKTLLQVIKVTGGQVTIKAPANLVIEAAGLNVKASGVLDLKGSLIKLNNGGKPAARVTSKTAGNQATQTVLDGSPTVLMP